MANAINSLNFNNNTYTFTLPYGTCSTAAGTAAKTVDVDNFSLEMGARVLVKFTITNTAASPTLNVEGTGAKAIYYRGSAINAGVLAANRTYEFVYNGTQWDLIGDLDTNTTYGAAGTSLGFVKSGGDVTISNGIITVNDDSHNHVIDNIDGLQDKFNTKSALKSVHDFDVGNTQRYLKVCTLTPKVGANDYNWVKFEVANNSTPFTEIVAYAQIAQNNVVTHKLQYNGSNLAYGYVYDDGVLEVWVKAINYAKTSIYPKSQFSRIGSITWDFEEADALPTDATSTVTATAMAWTGNAATATKLGTSTIGSSSQPIYLSAGTPTKISAIGTAYGGTGATSVSGARSNLEVYSKTEVDNKVIGVKNDLLNGAGPAYDTLKELGVLIDENTDAIDALETIAASKLPINGGTMTGDIKFTKKGITYVPGNTDQYLWKVYSNEDGKYGYRLQYNGTAEGNKNTLVLIADNQEGDEVNAVTMYQDGTTTFAKRITASGGITGTLTGNATTATSATKATQDGSGNNIVNTYATKATVNTNLAKSITGLSVSGQTITYTKGDGTTGSIKTQDTNTTYTFNGAVSTIKDNNLIANRALISNGSGKIAVSDITSTELNYLDGVTSNIQTQLNAKLSKSGGTMTGQLTFSGIGYTFGASGYTANNVGNWTAGASAGSWNIYKSDGTTNVFQLMFGNGNIKTPGTVTATGGFVGNASSATKLATKRTINGTDFDGSGNITTSSWGTARTLTIGDKSQSVNGSQDISWSLNDIGAAPDGLWRESYIDISIEGDADTYYPVLIKASYDKGFPWARLSISRSYSWTAPNSWYNSTHKGGLTLALQWTGDSTWGGNDHYIKVERFHEQYCHMIGGLQLSTDGLIVWLRGGVANYRIHSDMGNKITASIKYSDYTSAGNVVYKARSYDENTVKTEVTKLSITASVTELNYVDGVTSNIQTQLNGKLGASATAAAAIKLTTSAGSKTQPVYFSDGKPVACTYALNKTVPADAKFTDTTYNIAKANAAGLVKPVSVITKPTINSITTTTGRYYSVQMSSDGNMFVNVPWVNNTYSLSSFGITATATELNYIDGVTSNIQTQLNNKVSNSMGYVNKALSWNSSSYLQNVILLIPVPQSTGWSGFNFIDGRFFCWKSGANVYDVIEINANCVYNQLKYHLESFGDYAASVALCVCKYNGVSYYAIKCPYHANPYNNVTFVGRIRSDISGGTNTVSLPLQVPYYNEDTGAVLNAEVKNSITDTLTTAYVTSANGVPLHSKNGFVGNLTGNATSAGSATTAINVSAQAGTTNANRHIWFSDSATETKRAYDDDFKYNPSTNVLTVGSITGNADTATKPLGFNTRQTSISWGTLANSSYTCITRWDTANGGSVVFADKDGQTSMQIDGNFYQSEGNYKVLDTSTGLQLAGGTMSGSIITPKDDNKGIIPHTDNWGQIGSAEKKFFRMYASTFYGNLSGTATKATQDGDGNTITSTYLKLSGGTLTGDLKVPSIEQTGYTASITATGWYRCFTFSNSNSEGKTNTIINISRAYNNTNNESYIFAITVNYNGGINITQLAGHYNTRIITKIRVDYTNSGKAYIDFYVNSAARNTYFVTANGYGTCQVPTAVSAATGTTYEFTTTNGVKTNQGLNATGLWCADESMSITTYANNEVNFGGTNNSSTIYFGYRATGSKPIPTKFIFGNTTGTADLQAKTVYLGSGTNSYISSSSYTGNAASATKATQDGSGNTITSTYLKLSGGTLSGKLTASGKISVPTSGSSWISGMTTGNASIAISTQNTSGSYHPIIAGKTYNGHIWNLGTYVDSIGFYGFKSGRTENATDWSFAINVSSGAINASGSITAASFHGSGSGLTSLNASNISSGTLAVARGGTGITSNPSMLINLGSTSAANVFATRPRPGITGTLGLANGGTGKTTAKDAANAFINALDTGSSAPVDADYYICQYAGGGTSTTTYHRRPTSALWTYMKGKIDTTYYKTVTKSGAIGSVTLADKTDYIYTGVTSLTLVYPSGNFECWLSVTTSTSAITLSFPSGTKFIGASITSLVANTTYEISIKNKVAIIKKVG